jgi:hypothetical protein
MDHFRFWSISYVMMVEADQLKAVILHWGSESE